MIGGEYLTNQLFCHSCLGIILNKEGNYCELKQNGVTYSFCFAPCRTNFMNKFKSNEIPKRTRKAGLPINEVYCHSCLGDISHYQDEAITYYKHNNIEYRFCYIGCMENFIEDHKKYAQS